MNTIDTLKKIQHISPYVRIPSPVSYEHPGVVVLYIVVYWYFEKMYFVRYLPHVGERKITFSATLTAAAKRILIDSVFMPTNPKRND